MIDRIEIGSYLFLIVATSLFNFKYLGIHQSPVPPSLQEIPQEALFTIKKAHLQDIAIDKISKCPPKERHPGIFGFLSTFLFDFFAMILGQLADIGQLILRIQQQRSFTSSITIMFLDELSNRNLVIIHKLVRHLDCSAGLDRQMFIHQSLLVSSSSSTENPNNLHIVNNAMMQYLPVKSSCPGK